MGLLLQSMNNCKTITKSVPYILFSLEAYAFKLEAYAFVAKPVRFH